MRINTSQYNYSPFDDLYVLGTAQYWDHSEEAFRLSYEGDHVDLITYGEESNSKEANNESSKMDSKPQGYRLVQFGIAPAGNSSPFAIDGHAKENLDIGNGSPLGIVDIIADWSAQFFAAPKTERNLYIDMDWGHVADGDTVIDPIKIGHTFSWPDSTGESVFYTDTVFWIKRKR